MYCLLASDERKIRDCSSIMSSIETFCRPVGSALRIREPVKKSVEPPPTDKSEEKNCFFHFFFEKKHGLK